MHISQSKKFVFVHNPKTAGLSTLKALGFSDNPPSSALYHIRPAEARERIFQLTWSDYFSFAFVRNPWDRMVSLYEYHRSIEYGLFTQFNLSHHLARTYAFEEWLAINESGQRRSNWYGVPQSEWTDGVSKVYAFEQYEEAMSEILERVKLPESKRCHVNKSIRGPYAGYYKDRKSIDIVAKLDKVTIQRFGYAFEDC
jgi:hypothetical protein